jgi:NAD(P)-dependent dehydrogenase (short-subunit alcohol dehydrogenase family)
MGRLEGRVAIVTGAGRGLGRAHALHLASQGAAVVVNDVGRSLSGDGSDPQPATEVVEEIERNGGRAIASFDDVADWDQAQELVESALSAFDRLDVLVNNAGILRDRTLANLSEDEWDAVLRVHLKGHAAPTRHAMAYWRSRAKEGQEVRASVIHTTSVAGLCGSFGQANYSAAKAAVLGLSKVVALEGEAYGVRSNAVSPSARTRFTMSMKGSEERLRPPEDESRFDFYAPENVSPLIGWLAEAECPANGQAFHCAGNRIFVVAIPTIAHLVETEGRWTPEKLDEELTGRLVSKVPIEAFLNPHATHA